MLSIICNACRGSLTRTIKSVDRNLQKYARLQTQADPAENTVTEKNVRKRDATIIKCKNKSLNFCAGQIYEKFEPVPLATKGWHHRKSIGDYFVLYPAVNPEDGKEIGETGPASFKESNLNWQLVANLKDNGFEKPSEIQRIAIPTLLAGKNTIIAAETGCGKTLAFLLPMLEQIIRWKTASEWTMNAPFGLILSPSRDLTHQLGIVAKKIARNTGVKIRLIVGGRTKQLMNNPIVDEVDLLIGSFGAVSKLTTTKIYTMARVRHVVLDEADTLLDDSFQEKLQHFLKRIKFGYEGPEPNEELPRSSQLTLVSATMPLSLPETLDEIINTDSLVRLTSENLHKISPQVPQKFVRLNKSDRAIEIVKLVKDGVSKNRQILIFCNRIKTCEWLYLFLNEMSINCSFTHGELHAAARADKFAEFQRGHIDVLVTTDVCSRGLDTVRVRHVVNFDFPLYTADYIHRCGRTGRLGSHERCQVTNFISSPREIDLLQKIEMSIRTSSPLPDVNANITNLINRNIRRNIDETGRLMNAVATNERLKK